MQHRGIWSYHDVLEAADATHLAVMGTESQFPLGRQLQISDDGGFTWKTVLYDSERGMEPDNIWFEFWTDLAHPSKDILVVTGYRAQLLPNSGNPAEYRYTGFFNISEDRGATWTRIPLDSNSRPGAVSMCNTTHGVMIIQVVGNRDNAEPDTRPDQILRTTDGWKTTTAIDVPAGIINSTEIVCPEPDTYIFSAYNEDLAETRIYRTTNGGESWQESGPLPEGVGKQEVVFSNSRDGWAVGSVPTGIGHTSRDVIARTSDGGMTWHYALNQAVDPAFGLLAIAFADDVNGIAVGYESKLWRTRDGGETWVQEYPPDSIIGASIIRSIVYPDKNSALALYTSGLMVKYSGRETLLPPTFTAPQTNSALPVEEVRVEWTPIQGARLYQLQVGIVSLDSDDYDPTVFDTPVLDTLLSETSLMLRDLEYRHCYYARIRSINEQDTSDWRQRRKGCLFHTVESADVINGPTILQPVSGETNVPTTIRVVWTSLENAVSYDLQIAINEFSFMIPDNIVVDETGITDTSRVVSGLNADTEYFVRVRAHFEQGVSEWSPVLAPHPFRTGNVTDVDDGPAFQPTLGISVSPQPAWNWARLRIVGLPSGSTWKLELYSVLGSRVGMRYSGTVSDTEALLDLRGLTNGMYFIRMESGRHSVTKRIYIQK